MKKVIPFLILLFAMFGCQKKQNTPAKEVRNVTNDTLFLKVSRLKLLPLKKSILKELEDISEFEQLLGQIDTLNRKSYISPENDFNLLSQEITEFSKSLPDKLKNSGVLSRMNQLNTYVLLLENTMKNNKQKDTVVIEAQIVKILKAYNSLTTQFNETENTISSDFKKELEKGSFKRDSLKQNEVAPLF